MHIVQANRFATVITLEMHMVVVMMTCGDAGFIAQRIPDHVVGGRDIVDDALLEKCLKGSVNRNAVVLFDTGCFYILMGQGIVGCKKNLQYPLSAGCNTERAVLQYVLPLIAHFIL